MRFRALMPAAALAAATVWCLVLLAVRRHAYGDGFPYLAWDLTLAWVPFALALLLDVSVRRRAPRLEIAAVAVAWLLFFPNAPYLVTELVHLGPEHRLFDSLVLASVASTGLALGFASLLLVQGAVARAFGAMAGWATAAIVLASASVGIYLGRVVRLNSWDVVARPHVLWSIVSARLADPFGNRYLLAFVVGLCGFLMLAYAGLYAVAGLVRDDRR